MFDTLNYTKQLEESGVPRIQAETHSRIMAEMITSNLATKEDLRELRSELQSDIKDIRSEMREIRYDIIFKLAAINVTTMTLAVAVSALLVNYIVKH